MRILLAVILVAAVGWSGYWLLGAWLAERTISDSFDARPAPGLHASHAGISVRGFPLRFDVAVDSPELRNPWTGASWSAPGISLAASGFRLTRLVAELPEGARLVHPEGGLEVSAAAPPRATLSLRGLRSLALDSATLSADGLVVATLAGAQTRLDRFGLTLRTAESGGDDATHYRLSLAAQGLAPDAGWLAAEPFRAPPPEVIEEIALEAVLALDGALDRAAAATVPPRLTMLRLDGLRIHWGGTLLEASGELVIGPSGRPEGVIDISARDWRRLLDAAAALGIVHPEIAPTWERALELLEEQGGVEGQLEVPLRFAEGRMRLGPLPIGAAPRLPGG